MGKLSWFSVALFIVCLLSWSAVRIVAYVSFDRGCEGHLKRAADANSIELAEKELQTAVSWIEANKMTQGYTSVIYNTPDEDVGFWYQNLKTALTKLQELPADQRGNQLTESNVLIKLRETLTDSGSHGSVVVTVPEGISMFPDNKLWSWFPIIAMILSVFLFFLGFTGSKKKYGYLRY